jgi:hypothetical protein
LPEEKADAAEPALKQINLAIDNFSDFDIAEEISKVDTSHVGVTLMQEEDFPNRENHIQIHLIRPEEMIDISIHDQKLMAELNSISEEMASQNSEIISVSQGVGHTIVDKISGSNFDMVGAPGHNSSKKKGRKVRQSHFNQKQPQIYKGFEEQQLATSGIHAKLVDKHNQRSPIRYVIDDLDFTRGNPSSAGYFSELMQSDFCQGPHSVKFLKLLVHGKRWNNRLDCVWILPYLLASRSSLFVQPWLQRIRIEESFCLNPSRQNSCVGLHFYDGVDHSASQIMTQY